jgi:muramoyltetrapeptide carboxypeptidase
MKNRKTVIPPALKPGSTIGIIAPSGSLHRRDVFEEGIRILHELGFRTKFPRGLWPGQDYLADTDHNRILEFRTMWNDGEVEGIMAARGGYGCLRIVDQLAGVDLAVFPKRFIGFSDITLLHNTLNKDHNIVSFHGPVVTSLARLSKASLFHFRETLLHPLSKWNFSGEMEILRGSGKTQGITTGGNLSTIVSTLGTPLQPFWKNKIIFLEDTAEHLYRLDRMLTQLKLSGLLDDISAILLGDFSDGLGLDRIETMRHHEAIWKRVLELVDAPIPVWAKFPIGHGRENMTLPFGLEITLDNGKKTLTGQA